MPYGPPVLTPALLEALERALGEQLAPITHCLQPGLGDEEIDQAVAPLGVTLPAEAKRWWGWHDGAVMPGDAYPALGPKFAFRPLADRVREYEFQRMLAEEVAEGDERERERAWPAHMFPFVDLVDGSVLMLDCSTEGEAATVWLNPVDGLYDDHAPAAPTVGQLVSWWVDALQGGGWLFDQDQQLWIIAADALPAQAQAVGLV